MMIQWDTVKAVLRGMFIAIHSYLKKQKKISNKQPNLTHKAIRERKNKNPKWVEGRKSLRSEQE